MPARAEKAVIERLAKYGFGTCVELDVATLEVPNDPDDPRAFQRDLKKNPDLQEFVAALFGRPIVAEVKEGRRSRKLILDGQHRIERAAAQGVTTVPCVFFERLTMRDAAAMFDILNTGRTALKPHDEFRAACISEAPQAQALDRALLERGLDGWGHSGPKAKRPRAAINLGAIGSVRKLQWDIKPDGLAHVEYTLDVIGEIWPWPCTEKSPHVRCIRGFGQFLRTKKVVEVENTNGLKALRVWDPAERDLLVKHLIKKYRYTLDGFLALAEARVQGGGGGGGSKGMEWLLQEELVQARVDAGLPARPLRPGKQTDLLNEDEDDGDEALAA